MKRTVFLLIIGLLVFASCKKEGAILKGDYVFHGDAAVLQTDSIIYGVIINKQVHKLNKQAEPFKKQPTDMVKVEIRGTVNNEKHETILWENKIEITEILDVEALPNEDYNNVIKLSQ
ncbi:hypothetical protein [Seonamhaeicola sp.]|uniref:hypothetical protein n=1 Tax=Seonamhaeicola sp. TaxID=1912245 RepID=UPI0026068378|nr:hypothetical protein [Seonamhaeicola sp.]